MEILLIDDEAEVRQPLALHLEDKGYRVRMAGSGEDGLWKLEERPADLVITDVRMPGLSGIDVLRRVRERWPATEVALITGYGTIEDAMEALRLGAYDFLLKPVRLTRLELLVRHCEERIRYSRDNRELREVVERLRELNEQKEKFTALANHEIRTPTTVAAGLVSLLSERVEILPEEVRRLVQEADKALHRLKEVVEDLGDLGAALVGGMRVVRRPLRAGDFTSSLEAQCELYRSLRKVTITLEVADLDPLKEIWVDERKLMRAAHALLQNAVKFTPDGGAVDVRVALSDGQLVISVLDTGVGIEERERERVFELFYEVADVRHHRTSGHDFCGGGLGIGLPLAQAVARAHGGGVEYAPNDGTGSRFVLSVPILLPAEEGAPPAGISSGPA